MFFALEITLHQAWYFTEATKAIAFVPQRCPWNAPVQICNFIIGCPLPRRKCLGALALSKTKHTALLHYTDFSAVALDSRPQLSQSKVRNLNDTKTLQPKTEATETHNLLFNQDRYLSKIIQHLLSYSTLCKTTEFFYKNWQTRIRVFLNSRGISLSCMQLL